MLTRQLSLYNYYIYHPLSTSRHRRVRLLVERGGSKGRRNAGSPEDKAKEARTQSELDEGDVRVGSGDDKGGMRVGSGDDKDDMRAGLYIDKGDPRVGFYIDNGDPRVGLYADKGDPWVGFHTDNNTGHQARQDPG
ncbi:hypothetical protein B0H13DRAFT_1904412 [Mycena leptocephala]|nr:hypothetical protein B0H13DRAFT_1904412 [Mycena leptocephala]